MVPLKNLNKLADERQLVSNRGQSGVCYPKIGNVTGGRQYRDFFQLGMLKPEKCDMECFLCSQCLPLDFTFCFVLFCLV